MACLFQTVLAFVMGTTLYYLSKYVSKPIADMLDARYQVSSHFRFQGNLRAVTHPFTRTYTLVSYCHVVHLRSRDFEIVDNSRLGRLDAYTGDFGRVQ